MRKPFWLVDGKLRESDFFLDQMREASDLEIARFYFSAFVSATRSVTFALQVCLKGLAESDAWYEVRRTELRKDPIATYFHEVRNNLVHVGLNPLGGLSRSHSGISSLYVVGESVPEPNAIDAATRYMALLVRITNDAFERFWSYLDLSSTLTMAQLTQQGTSLEEIEEEFGLPPGWSGDEHVEPEIRIDRLKIYSHTDIDRLRQRYVFPEK